MERHGLVRGAGIDEMSATFWKKFLGAIDFIETSAQLFAGAPPLPTRSVRRGNAPLA
jgi:hypothetical protein